MASVNDAALLKRIERQPPVFTPPATQAQLQSQAKSFRQAEKEVTAAETEVTRKGPLTRALLRSTTALAAAVESADGGSAAVSARDVAALYDSVVSSGRATR